MLRKLARRSAGRYRSAYDASSRRTRSWTTWTVPRPTRSPRSRQRRLRLRTGRRVGPLQFG